MRRGLTKALCALLAVASLASCGNINRAEAGSDPLKNILNNYLSERASACADAVYIGEESASFSLAMTQANAEAAAEYMAEEEAFYVLGGSPAEVETQADNIKVGSRFWELFFGKNEPMTLIASGDVFGIRMQDKYPAIVEAPGVPALRCGDRILSVNGKETHSAKEVKDLINNSGGESVTICAMRGNETLRLELVPKEEGGEYRLGITLKDMTAGIGTITFIDPESGEFGGLGHGICDGETGAVIEMARGDATQVLLGGIHKGEIGSPGELSGVMTENTIGQIAINTQVGVFGRLNNSANLTSYGKAMEVGHRSEVKAGEATIISTVKNGKKAEYKIEIYDIDQSSTGSKSFRIRVKDPALIAITGGIVRGMSGSPIIQNGKLVGAVTHVLVADPTEGYGIFIDNMLSAAREQKPQPKAA